MCHSWIAPQKSEPQGRIWLDSFAVLLRAASNGKKEPASVFFLLSLFLSSWPPVDIPSESLWNWIFVEASWRIPKSLSFPFHEKRHIVRANATSEKWLLKDQVGNFFFVFWVLLRVHGSAYRLVFTKSLHSLSCQSCDWEIDKFSYSALIYRPHSQRPVRKENDFVSKVPERESNSSYTARVDPFPSALSTRPSNPPRNKQDGKIIVV